MKAIAGLGILVLLLWASPAVSQVPDDKLIVPGVRIGKWTLKMTVDDLVQMNGRDYFENKDASIDLRDELLLGSWIHLALLMGHRKGQTRVELLEVTDLSFTFPLGDPTPKALKEKYPDITVNEISRSGPAGTFGVILVRASTKTICGYETAEGVSLCNDFHERITEAFGKPTAESAILQAVTPPKRWIYDERGIAFRVQDLRITSIFIFRPGTAKTIWKF